MKSYLLLLPLCAAIVACASQAPKTQLSTVIPASQSSTIAKPKPAPNIKPAKAKAQTYLHELQVDTDLSTVGAPMDWMQFFSAISFKNANSSHNLGFSQRVASFSTAAELKADSLAHLKLVPAVPPAKKMSLADEMVKRASSQIDFNSNDLVVVYLTTGGPPFGEYRYSMVSDTMEFCIEPASNANGKSGKSLKSIAKFYAAPKSLKVKMCGR